MCWICVLLLLMHVGPLKSYILALRETSQLAKAQPAWSNQLTDLDSLGL
jgi:hypothetical protein